MRFHWDTKQKFCWLATLASFNFNCIFIDTARYSSRIPLFCPMVFRIVNCTNFHHLIALIWQHKSRKNFAARYARRWGSPFARGSPTLVGSPFFSNPGSAPVHHAQGKLVLATLWIALFSSGKIDYTPLENSQNTLENPLKNP